MNLFNRKSKNLFFSLSFLFISAAFGCSGDKTTRQMNDNLQPPIAKKINKELVQNGDVRVDPYYWLNERAEPAVIDYLTSENAYTKGMLAHTEKLQETIYKEIVGRIKKDDTSVAYQKNGYIYQTQYQEENEYPVYVRTSVAPLSKEEVMLNVNDLAKDFSYYATSGLKISPNNKILAYGEDTLSRRIYTIRFKNLETGEMLKDQIPNTSGTITWAADNKTIFYSVKDETLRSYKIFKHKLGTNPAKDQEIYHEADDTFRTFIYKTKSEKYLVIGSFATLTNEYRILEADNPDGEFRMFQPRDRAGNLEYSFDHKNDKFYIVTNYKAKNFRLMETNVNATDLKNWKEVIPNRNDVLLEDVELFDDYMVLSERKNGITNIRVMADSGSDHYIDFGEKAYLAYTSTNVKLNTEVVRIGYQSMTTPGTIYDYNMKTRNLEQRKQTEVVGDFKPANYQSERFFVKARDGAEIPVSLVYKKGTKIDGTAPLLLYAYGSYGANMEPYFSAARLSLLDRGFVYVIAHIRGGQEMGRQWYEDGKLLKKKNTFTDYIDCAEYLVAEKYADPDRLFAMGGSAGGLLMGAVVNMRPELWRGVIAAVPFVDVITTMLDETIPLTTGEFDEWGNPKDKEYYDYIKSYSPYDNIEKKDYPNMLVTTGLHDSQVQYWEPAKWVAKLRDLKTDDNLLLLSTEMEAGHGGASGRFKRNKETAMEYAFLVDLAGEAQLD